MTDHDEARALREALAISPRDRPAPTFTDRELAFAWMQQQRPSALDPLDAFPSEVSLATTAASVLP